MKKLITVILVMMLSAMMSQAVYAKAVGKFVKVEGRVDITRPGNPAESVNVGTEIFEKDIIRSKSNSKAEILFTDGNVLRLAQKTRVEVSEYISDSNRRSSILNLFRGKIQNKVKKLFGGIFGSKKNRYEVHTPTSVCGVRGTDFFMSYQKGVSGATFKEGVGYAYNRNQPDNIIEVQAGQSMVIADSSAPPIVRTVSRAEIDRLEEDTTPAEENDENADEEDSSGEMDGSGGEGESDVDETVSGEDEVEEGSSVEESESEVVDDEAGGTDSDNTDSGVDGVFEPDENVEDLILAGDMPETTSQTDNVDTIVESVDTDTDANDETQVEIIQEVTEDNTTTTPIMNISGQLMGLVSGTHIEGEHVLPRSIDPYRTGYTGRIEGSIYEYDYFQADDGSYLRGSAEEEDGETGTWTRYSYLPGGILLTEVGAYEEYVPEITEGTWTQSDLASIATAPSTDYYLRHENEFEASMITGIGSFTGEILGFPAEMWSATQSAPSEISLSGQYTWSGDPLYIFKSKAAGSFSDGGAYSGIFSGNADSATGFFHALYINPEGTELGILRSDFTGSVETTGIWSAAGTMYPTIFSSIEAGTMTSDDFLSSINHGYLEVERLTGNFTDSELDVTIKAHGFGDTSYISGYDWGIFEMTFGYAKYDESLVSSTWTGSVSGFGEFGDSDGGIWTADITGGTWDANGIEGVLNGEFLTMTKRGTIEGNLIGPAGSAGDWTAVSQGTWQTTDDLQFSSSLDGSLYFIRSEMGGRYYNSTSGSEYSYHYNLESHEGGYQFYNSADDTDTYMQINAWDFDGTTADFSRQEWVYDHTSYAFISYSADQVTEFLLESLEDVEEQTGLTLDYWDYPEPETWTNYNMFNSGWFEGILGGLDSPWAATSTAPADITLLGFYEVPFYMTSGQPIIFANDIESKNPDIGNATTFDGGAYTGYMGGLLASSVSGNLYAIYIDPANNAGILLGEFEGLIDETSGIWEADGGIYPVQLYSSISVAPDSLSSSVMYTEYHLWGDGYTSPGDDGYFFDGLGAETGYFENGGGHFFNKSIMGEPWGVWQNVVGGAYTGTPTSDWTMYLHHEMWDEYDNVTGMITKYGVSDGTWAGNEIEADVVGAWVDLDDVVVGVSSGKLKGTYDPVEMTWQTIGSGVWLRAGQFIDMATTTEGRTTLAELNIPAIEIGRTTLTGTGSSISSVTMTDVTFFASSTGGDPQIWATDNISGTFVESPYVGDYISMANTDSSVTADFTLRKWDNNSWAADISNGNGTINRIDIAGTADVEFVGVAGGTYTGTTSGDFSGEGAGIVR